MVGVPRALPPPPKEWKATDPSRRGALAPIEVNQVTGDMRLAWPTVLDPFFSFSDAVSGNRPYEQGVWRYPDGTLSDIDPRLIDDAFGTAGLVGVGSPIVPRPAGSLGAGGLPRRAPAALPMRQKLARTSGKLYDPPAVQPRSFETDYPAGASNGRLRIDIEGRPLVARHVVGRTEAGGSDVALPGSAYDEVAKAGTGSAILAKSQGLPRGTVGAVSLNRWTGRPEEVLVSPRLTPEQFERTSAHEIGHVIDQVA